jgi:NADH-quinone oxidoreductase subunit K
MSAIFEIGATHFLVVAALIFALGVGVIITRRNAVAVLLGIELMLNGAALNFVTFSRFMANDLDGQMVAIFIIIAAAEAAVALAIVLNLFHVLDTVHVDDADELKE